MYQQSRSPPPGFQYAQPSQQLAQPANGLQQILAYGQQATQAAAVADEEYNRLLKNYRLAHERIEDQRQQMLEQEKQNALLRKHIALLEGGDGTASIVGAQQNGGGGSTVDDFTIKNSSSNLERRINRWAAETLRTHAALAPPLPPGTDPSAFAHLALIPLAEVLFEDIESVNNSPFLLGVKSAGFDYPGLGIVVQSLLRHVMGVMLAEGIVNELLVTNSDDANRELTKVHDQLFSREPLVASVWRRQTFSAAVESLNPAMAISIFHEHMNSLYGFLNPGPTLSPPLSEVLEASYTFSRMLHASKSPIGGSTMESTGLYRAYVPDIGTQLDPGQLELIKKCYRTERGEPERVGACLFPGLVKVSAVDTTPVPQQSIRTNGPNPAPKPKRETRTVVVRRAQVICECALAAAYGPLPPQAQPQQYAPQGQPQHFAPPPQGPSQ